MIKKTLWHKLIEAYPNLSDADFDPIKGSIELRNDGDEFGDYIAKWSYVEPLIENFKIGK